MSHSKWTRREFLNGGGILVVGFSLLEPTKVATGKEVPDMPKSVATDEVDAFLAITPDEK